MKRIPFAIVGAAFVTVLGFFFLASAILPGSEDSQLPSNLDSDNAGSDVESTLQSRIAVLTREHRIQELACAPIEAQVHGLIANSQGCNVNSDCAIVRLGCPFGCSRAVSKLAVAELVREEKSYRSQCHWCEYHCSAAQFEWRAVCRNNQCQVMDLPESQMQPSPSS